MFFFSFPEEFLDHCFFFFPLKGSNLQESSLFSSLCFSDFFPNGKVFVPKKFVGPVPR